MPSWSEQRWVGLVANKLKGKVLEAYAKMSVRDIKDYDEFKADTLRACKPIACSSAVVGSGAASLTWIVLIIWISR